MALISCPECGREVSDKAKTCPHCGYGINTDYKEVESKTHREKKGVSPKLKKIFKIILVALPIIIILLFLSYLLFSPKTFKWCCIHKVQVATCTTPKKCVRCGKTWGTANGHKWKEATCTEPKTCKVCGATEGLANGHEWKSATCTEPKECKICGKKEGTANGHTWSNATCISPKKCKVCGATTGKKLGHNVKDYICTRCGETIISKNDVKNVIDIENLRYEINSVGGIEFQMTFVNKSKTKTINYITMEIEFYNAVGDLLKNDIGGRTTASIYYTGPLGAGKRSNRTYWDPCFYNNSFSGTMHFNEIKIDYSDGTSLVLKDNNAAYAVKSWR